MVCIVSMGVGKQWHLQAGRPRPSFVTSARGRPRLQAVEVRRPPAAGRLPRVEGRQDLFPQGPAPRAPPEFGFSGCQEPSRGTLGCCWLRVARSGEAVLLDSGRAGRSSPYRFALMIFLKERDSCEQTGLTGTAFLHTPQGISFCLRLTSKSVIGPCQRRDKEDLGCLLGRVLAAHPSGLFCGPRGKGGETVAGPSGTETGTRSKEVRTIYEGRKRNAMGRSGPSQVCGVRSRDLL